jgi:hypothetical protein
VFVVLAVVQEVVRVRVLPPLLVRVRVLVRVAGAGAGAGITSGVGASVFGFWVPSKAAISPCLFA